MKIFVVGLQHTQTSPKFSTCAFTMKVWHLCKMMTDRGHNVIHLGNGGSHPVCTENVELISTTKFHKVHGHPGTDFYNTGDDGGRKEYKAEFYSRVEQEIQKRTGRPWTEIICSPWGSEQAEALASFQSRQFVVESGIGYKWTFAKYKVFESYGWMHFHWGRDGRYDGNGWDEVVIPNAFDPGMFTLREKKDDYFLFCGRLNSDKGVDLAIRVTKQIGAKLIIVGQGDPRPYMKNNPHVSYVAPVGIQARDDLMGGARALFCPTYYCEPFGGVAVEAQMCGTPVISTDWGAFPETVLHGTTGFRCRAFEQFVWAAQNIDTLKPHDCRFWAVNNFGLKKVASMYDDFFTSIIREKQIDESSEVISKRQALDWLNKEYPAK